MLDCHQALLRALLIPMLGVLFLNVLPVSTAYSKSSQVTFELGQPGLALDTVNGMAVLRVAIRLNNTCSPDTCPIDGNAYRVQIQSMTLSPVKPSPSLLSPIPLPAVLGEIDAGQNAVIQAVFSASGLSQGVPYTLQVNGSYRPVDKGTQQDQGHVFSLATGIVLPPTAESGALGAPLLNNTTEKGSSVSGAPFKHIPLPQNFDEANEAGPPVPTGPSVALPNAIPGGTMFMNDPPGDPSVAFTANDPLSLISGGFNGQASTTAEPSGGANGGGVIFATANWTAAYSTNGGSSFTQLDPTTIFPNDAVGYCCDQVIQYVPSIDRFVWLLQGTGYRIATASPADIKNYGATAWTYWNLTPTFFGLAGKSLDYPDMSVGDNDLYLSFDEVGTGLMVVRISLAQLQAGGTIFVEWTDPKNGGPAYGGHVMQDTGNEIFWAGHNSTSQMRIFSLAEGSTTYFWRDINIGSWSNTGLSSTTPDGNDFLTKLRNFPGNAVIGATRALGPGEEDGLWFAWSAGTDGNFKQPHVEMVTLDKNNNFKPVQQVQIWNPSYTFVYPSLATNACTGEVGFSLEGGGSGNYENHLVGFWGDFVAYITTNSNIGTTRYGDYVTIRQDDTPGLNGAFFDAFGYGLNKPGVGQTGTQTDVRYVQFGRAGDCQGPS
jgi:hypothetical protein